MKLSFLFNAIISIIAIVIMIIFLPIGLGDYAYIPLLVSVFTYANTRVIMFFDDYIHGRK